MKTKGTTCWAWDHMDMVRANTGTGPSLPSSVIDAIREHINDKNTFTWTNNGIQFTSCGQMLRSRMRLKDAVIDCVECLAVFKGEL